MSLLEFIKLFGKHFNLMILTGVSTAALVFYLTKGEKALYYTTTTINTGIISGYTIERSKNSGRIDREHANNEIANLISLATAFTTIEDLSMKLIATYLSIDLDDPKWVTYENKWRVEEALPDSLFLGVEIDTSAEITFQNLKEFKETHKNCPFDDLIYSDHDFFGVEWLQGISVNRKDNSDLIVMTYTTSDPAICQQTLITLTDMFIKKYKKLKEGQSEDVLGFFEQATKESQDELKSAENNLLEFRVDNKIINYYEQTRFIAGKKEDLDERSFDEMMTLEATQAALQRVEQQLGAKGKLTTLNAAILDKRKEVSDVTSRLAQYEILSLEGEPINKVEVDLLEDQLDTLKKEIEQLAVESYAITYTPEGIGSDQILSEWLKAVISLEQTSSRLAVIQQRKREFNDIYSRFAPWGSRLKKIEREIGLAENAYLENLHSYNQARLHLQNTLMSANLQVMDAPFYPNKDLGSQRGMLVVVGFLAGFSLTFGVIILMEFLDTTLKRPAFASRTIGLDLCGVFPKFPNYLKRKYKIDYAFVRNRTTDIALQNIKINLPEQEDEPQIIIITSIRGQEGVTFISRNIVQQLKLRNDKVLHLYPKIQRNQSDSRSPIEPNLIKESLPYSTRNFHKIDFLNIKELLNMNPDLADKRFDFIVLELPAIIFGTYPIELIGKSSATMLVCRSNRSWNSSDRKALKGYRQLHKNYIGLIINGVKPDALEDIMGEVPKRRSFIRRFIKRVVLFKFSEKAKI